MHSDMVSRAALDFVLRRVVARTVRVSFVADIFRVHLQNNAADVPSFRIPGHVVSDLEVYCHRLAPFGSN
ncbi:hypothetical protein MCP1_250002 [Candidatus Terasakiella magnetica]|nr:hypothetical protein MCP1_250002 [Candidatus Terasakiella magnetica]